MDSFIDKFAQQKNAQEMIRANAMAEAKEREKMAAQLSEYENAMRELRRCSLQNIENAEKVKELLEAGLNKIAEVQKKEEGGSESSNKDVEEVRNLLESLKDQMSELLGEQQNRMSELLGEQQNRMSELLGEQQNRIADFLENQQSQMASILVEQKNQVAELLNEQSSRIEEKSTQTAELMDAQKKTIEELFHASEEFNHKEAVKVYRNVQAVIEGALPKQTEEITAEIKKAGDGKGISAKMVVLWGLTFLAAAANVVIEVLKILGYL